MFTNRNKNDNDYERHIIQTFPGQYLPDLPENKMYPDPNIVGRYVTKSEFLKLPKWNSQWAHLAERSQMILAGNYFDLKPVHFEGIFTLICNFLCPHCTRRTDRTEWGSSSTWSLERIVNDTNTANFEKMKKILSEAAQYKVDDQMGIVWGGGDPALNPFVYDAMFYAKQLGIKSSFITNGVFMNVDKLLEIEPALIRVSLNCGTEDKYVKFHGYPQEWDYFNRAIDNIKYLNQKKSASNYKTLFGISLILDDRNIEDLKKAAEFISNITAKDGKGIDYVIIRPVMQYKHLKNKISNINDALKSDAFKMIIDNGSIKAIFDECSIPLIPIKDSFFPPPADNFYADSTDCLAYGMCGEIRFNGDLQLCSDSYGNPDYTIGNLFEQSIEEIWQGQKRKTVLESVNRKQCYKKNCPFNSRGHHHNRIFHQIEKLRANGEIERVKEWIDDLKTATYALGHSFFN